MPDTIIAFNSSESGQLFWMSFFDSVTPVARVINSYSNDLDDGQHLITIYICKKPKQDFNGLKQLFKKRVFE